MLDWKFKLETVEFNGKLYIWFRNALYVCQDGEWIRIEEVH